MRDSQPGKPVQRRVLDGAGDIDESTMAVVRGQYSIQWFRDGAADNSARFRVWAYSSAGRYAATAGLPVLPHTEVYHGIGGDFAPFAMMRLTDPTCGLTP